MTYMEIFSFLVLSSNIYTWILKSGSSLALVTPANPPVGHYIDTQLLVSDSSLSIFMKEKILLERRRKFLER